MTEIATFLEIVQQNAPTYFGIPALATIFPLIAGHGTVLSPISRGCWLPAGTVESGKTGEHLVRVQLPRDLTCAHCSLTYVAGETYYASPFFKFKNSL